MSEIVICGLLSIEQAMLKHKGECEYCMHYNYIEHTTVEGRIFTVPLCTKDGKITTMKEVKNNCKDWLLDTR